MKTCDCFDKDRQKELVGKYKGRINQFLNRQGLDVDRTPNVKVALFEKTGKCGRPSSKEAILKKTQKTYFIVVKVNSLGGMCQVAGNFTVPKEDSAIDVSDTTTSEPKNGGHEQNKETPSTGCCGSRPMRPKQPQSDTQAVNSLHFGPIFSTNGPGKQHQCHCGSDCKCALCPEHPGTESTRQILAEAIGQRMFPQSNLEPMNALSSAQVHGCKGQTTSNSAISESLDDAVQSFPNLDPTSDNLFVAEFNIMDEFGSPEAYPLIPQNLDFDAFYQPQADQVILQTPANDSLTYTDLQDDPTPQPMAPPLTISPINYNMLDMNFFPQSVPPIPPTTDQALNHETFADIDQLQEGNFNPSNPPQFSFGPSTQWPKGCCGGAVG